VTSRRFRWWLADVATRWTGWRPKVVHLDIEPVMSDRLTPGWCRPCAKSTGVVWELTVNGSRTTVIGTYGKCTECGGHDIEPRDE